MGQSPAERHNKEISLAQEIAAEREGRLVEVKRERDKAERNLAERKTLTADEVREVVQSVVARELVDIRPFSIAEHTERIATRVAEKLAGATVSTEEREELKQRRSHVCPSPIGLTEPDRVRLQRIRVLLQHQPVHWDIEEALLARLIVGGGWCR